MAFAKLLRNLIRDPGVGRRIVPIVPDEARTFGLDPLFKEVGIYAAHGQLYDPVDSNLILSYREATDGQVLEEGITEAGATAEFQAAATAYASHGEPMIPFYIFYSMFGFQRTGDAMWALGDVRARGFLMGATAGRTTLHGEGLQHDDGHSQLLASVYPSCRAYHQPARPAGLEDGIVRGLYRFAAAPKVKGGRRAPRATLLGSGSIMQQVLAAQVLLAERYGVAAEVWSAPSFSELRREALAVERWNRLHPAEPARIPYVTTQ